tara:strand:- start:73 stop:300 length:228 start_codon:yes stop_codon:yes gene_type:complete
MQKGRFHNSKVINENLNKTQTNYTQDLDPKIVVDINKLLNRVKIDERNEKKKKFIFFSLLILGLGFIGTFIAFIK